MLQEEQVVVVNTRKSPSQIINVFKSLYLKINFQYLLEHAHTSKKLQLAYMKLRVKLSIHLISRKLKVSFIFL